MNDNPVVIVGGGLSGLTCALQLDQAGIPYRLLEASDAVGGRVRTDDFEGFKLDRGFQVLSTAYPEALAILEYDQLELGHFEPGALVRFREKLHRFVDPWRRPKHLLSTAVSPIASTMDKFRVASLRRRVCKMSLDQLYNSEEKTTRDALKQAGFSETIINRFFRPFLGGVFLETDLETSSRKFEFVFRMFAQGDAALPKAGMQQIPLQIAAKLKCGSIELNCKVERVQSNRVYIAGGKEIDASAVVLACEKHVADQLTGGSADSQWHSATTLYYAADKPPVDEPILVLNGDGEGPVNNMCVPSLVCNGYAPEGLSLVSVSVVNDQQQLDDQTLDKAVKTQLAKWFGADVSTWRHLKTYRIKHALPVQNPPALYPVEKSPQREDGLFLCGDYMDTASINGAMAAGRRAAEAIVQKVAPATIG